MKRLKHAASISEGAAMDIIFNAARANERREERTNVFDYSVSFIHLDLGYNEYMARVYDRNGFEVANATVDKFDI